MGLAVNLEVVRQGLPRHLTGEPPDGGLGHDGLALPRGPVGRGQQLRQDLAVGQGADLLEAADHRGHVELGGQGLVVGGQSHGLEAGLAVHDRGRGMAVQAGAGLGLLGDPLGHVLVVQHVGVPARLAVVDAERVPGVEPLEPGLVVQLALGHGVGSAVELVARGGLVAVELVRPVPAPGLGVGADLVDVHHAHGGLPGLLLALEHHHEDPGHPEGGHEGQDEDQGQPVDAAHFVGPGSRLRSAARVLLFLRVHELQPPTGRQAPRVISGNGRRRCGSSRRGAPLRWPRRAACGSRTPSGSADRRAASPSGSGA